MYYSYDIFKLDTLSIIQQIKDSMLNDSCKQIDKIVCLTRGGSVLGTFLSHALNLPVSYCNMEQAITEIIDAINNNQNTLIVDDILDSGDTLSSIVGGVAERDVREHPLQYLDNKIAIAVSICNTDAINKLEKYNQVIPLYYGTAFRRSLDKEWITFFWELIQ